MERQRMKLLK